MGNTSGIIFTFKMEPGERVLESVSKVAGLIRPYWLVVLFALLIMNSAQPAHRGITKPSSASALRAADARRLVVDRIGKRLRLPVDPDV